MRLNDSHKFVTTFFVVYDASVENYAKQKNSFTAETSLQQNSEKNGSVQTIQCWAERVIVNV